VFVHDRQTGTTTLVNTASDGTPATAGTSLGPALSEDGRYVAFESSAPNLLGIGVDTNDSTDVFVRDRAEITMVRASQGLHGGEGDGGSDQPSWNQDGTKMLYRTAATNLDWTEDDGAARDVMLYNPLIGTNDNITRSETAVTTRASVASDGTQGNGDSYEPSMSADGRYVAFYSNAVNLVAGNADGTYEVFVRDRQTGTTSLVSVASDGTEGNGSSFHPDISGNARYVAFESSSTNLVAGDTNGFNDVFVHDRQTGTSTRVSVASDGSQATDGGSSSPVLSADGRFVAFHSNATNLVAGDSNGLQDVFVHDLQTGATTRASVASDGTQADSSSYYPRLSADGRYVAFSSDASNLVAGDTNGTFDVFVHDRQTGTTTRVSLASDGTQATGGSSSFPVLSADGRYVGFYSSATNLVAGDTNGMNDVFVHDRQTGTTNRVSVAYDGSQATGGGSTFLALSGDGRSVAFESLATNLQAEDTNGRSDLFVRRVLFP